MTMTGNYLQQEIAGRRVLVVEDSRLFASALVRLLTLLGWSAYSVYSAEEARDYLQTEAVDILLLDMGLPGMNGRDFLKVVREMGITIPIVALSGQRDEYTRNVKGPSAFSAYLMKPIDMKELQQSLLALV